MYQELIHHQHYLQLLKIIALILLTQNHPSIVVQPPWSLTTLSIILSPLLLHPPLSHHLPLYLAHYLLSPTCQDCPHYTVTKVQSQSSPIHQRTKKSDI